MRNLSLFVIILLGLLFPSASVFAQATKVDVCHLEAHGSYHLINISDSAFEQHVAHGDASPGDAVPGMAGYVFAEDCSPTIAALILNCNDPPIEQGLLPTQGITFIIPETNIPPGPDQYGGTLTMSGNGDAFHYTGVLGDVTTQFFLRSSIVSLLVGEHTMTNETSEAIVVTITLTCGEQ